MEAKQQTRKHLGVKLGATSGKLNAMEKALTDKLDVTNGKLDVTNDKLDASEKALCSEFKVLRREINANHQVLMDEIKAMKVVLDKLLATGSRTTRNDPPPGRTLLKQQYIVPVRWLKD